MKRLAVVATVAATLVAATPAVAHAHGDNWRSTRATKWTCLSHYESTHRWNYNGPSGHDGGLQFAPSTWTAYTGRGAPAHAWQATRRFQIAVARRVAFTGYRHHPPQGLDAWAAWDRCR